MTNKYMISSIALIAALGLSACETMETASSTETVAAAEAAESAAMTSTPAPEKTAPDVTGLTVQSVAFANGGRLAKSGEGTWTEYDKDTGQPAFFFTEDRRDDWSVYLSEVGSDKKLQIDIHREKLLYGRGDSPRIDLYDIANSSVDVPAPLSAIVYEGVTGANLSLVTFGDQKARFEQTGPKTWTEYNQEGKKFNTFTETHRDEWSVYLKDEGRNIRLQLDVHRDMILLGQNGGAMADQWPITSAARPRTNLTDAAG